MNTPSLPSPVSGRILLLVSPASTLPDLFDLVARLALQGSVCVFDGGNTFQGYLLARSLRRQVPDPTAPLQRVLLSRVFTCYQMAALLDSESFPAHPILLLDFLATFYDQSVRVAERRRLLRGCLRRLREISRRTPVAIWVQQRQVIPEEALSFLDLVQSAAGQVWYPPRRPALPVAQQPALFPL